MFLLNRIIDPEKKKFKKLLQKYNVKYIEIPFKLEEFQKIKYNKEIIEHKKRQEKNL